MGQSKSRVTTGADITPHNVSLTTLDRNRVEGGTTTTITLQPRDKMAKSRSISSLSRALKNRRWKPKRRRSISASFNMNDQDIKVELINVNKATEEELMTLPGVNRTLAQNIINHRSLIGGYRRVDDLALVSGMGATKLDLIRNEVCTNLKRSNISRASSKSPSMESLPSSNGSSSRNFRPPKLVNLNCATIFELMAVPGIHQALAAKIITYRDKKVTFKDVDELHNVGISYRYLGALRMYLTVEPSIWNSNNSSDEPLTELPLRDTPKSPPNTNSHRRSTSVPPIMITDSNLASLLPTGLPSIVNTPQPIIMENMVEIFELMSLKSQRPLRQDCTFTYKYNERPAYRIASWNLEKLTNAKISNLGVLEVITRTILENGLSVVALQEVYDRDALKNICNELNDPQLSRNRVWKKPRGTWTYLLDDTPFHCTNKISHHQMGILYNRDQIQNVRIPKFNATIPPIQNGSLWQFSIFNVSVRKSSWNLINVLSTPLSHYTNGHAEDPQQETLDELIQTLVSETGADGAILLGSFESNSVEKGIGKLRSLERIAISSPSIINEIDSTMSTPVGSIWVTSGMKQYVTGETGQIAEGLSHLAIPNGWLWGGRVTVSNPIWCSLYEEI